MSADAVAPLVGVPSRDVFAEAADLSNAELERRLLTLAGQIASAEAELLIYLGAFDLADGWAGWPSLPAWLSFFTAMSVTTAREHVRVARALRALPVTRQAMLEGQLSFSKVRALTRVAEPETEAELVQTAQSCSAAQLDRICAALVKTVGPAKAKERRAAMSLTTAWDPDGNLVGTFRLPPEDGKVLLAAIERLMPDPILNPATQPRSFSEIARAQQETAGRAAEAAATTADAPAGASDGPDEMPPPGAQPPEARAPDDLSDPATAFARGKAVGLVELARHSLSHAIEDGLAATSVETVIHVDAAAMDRAIVRRRLVQAGVIVDHSTQEPGPDTYVIEPPPDAANGALPGLDPDLRSAIEALERVSATGLAVGWVEDGPALALETIERLLCDGRVRTRCGHEHPDAPDPRAHRLPTAAQRRRLWRRDHGCRAPGCTRKRGLHAHHIVPWWQGGETTLANMVLVCEAHHHLIHEGGWILTLRDGHVTLTSPDGARVLIEAPHIAGSSHALTRTRPTTVGPRTISGHQTGEPLDLDYATSVIATNIELARARLRGAVVP